MILNAVVLFFTLIVFTTYILLILWLMVGIKKLKTHKELKNAPKTGFSVIIPFRNEHKQLPALLSSIDKLTYPKSLFEIIFVDDDSEDHSVAYIETHIKSTGLKNASIIKNNRRSQSPKKDAIQTAIEKAQFDWILTTDADCILPEKWLLLYDAYVQAHQPELIAGPVSYLNIHTFLDRFQQLDFLSLQGTTMGSFGQKHPFLCNGANLAYRKETFVALNGFSDNNHVASGDDIFLLEKVNRTHPNKAVYLKNNEATVLTKTENSWSALIQQRIRWASKTTAYKSFLAKGVGILVFITNLSIIGGILLFFFKQIDFYYLGALLLIKFLIDFLLLANTAHFFKQKITLVEFCISALIYPFFSVFIACKSMSSGYSWKERNFSG